MRMGRSWGSETVEVWGLVGGSGSLESEGMLRSVGGRGSGRSVSERRG